MTYSKKYLYEFSKYLDSESILVINSQGALKRIYVPFKVIVLLQLHQFIEGDILFVDAVKVTDALQNVFIIEGKAYSIKYFGIL